MPKPDLASLQRLRFLTTVDFPPLNFIDRGGRLSGFHIDLARSICQELAIIERCQIQALPWDQLPEAISSGEGEAIIAGMAVTEAAREQYGFSRPYLQFPARFVVRTDRRMTGPIGASIKGQQIGTLQGSAHEIMLRDYFPGAIVAAYPNQLEMTTALRDGKLAAVFGDGMPLGFWIGSQEAANCCEFQGGPYLAPEFLGAGLAIAVPRDRPELAEAFDYALQQLQAKGTFAELYLRYFPVGFF